MTSSISPIGRSLQQQDFMYTYVYHSVDISIYVVFVYICMLKIRMSTWDCAWRQSQWLGDVQKTESTTLASCNARRGIARSGKCLSSFFFCVCVCMCDLLTWGCLQVGMCSQQPPQFVEMTTNHRIWLPAPFQAFSTILPFLAKDIACFQGKGFSS